MHHRITAVLIALLLGTLSCERSQQPPKNQAAVSSVPKAGVSTAGAYLRRKFGNRAWNLNVYPEALDCLGVDFIDEHYCRVSTGGTYQENRTNTLSQINDYIRFAQTRGSDFLWNLEISNFRERIEYRPGKNFFESEPGLHYFKMPEEWLRELSKTKRFIGVTYDELEHMQLSSNRFMRRDCNGDVPALVDTTGMSLEQAYDAIVDKAVKLRDYYGQYGALCNVEMVWPVMHHIFARAGWTLSPKLLKESWNPAVIAMALGAAIEYQAKGANLWFSPDLWFRANYPGHSVNELRSALLAAHWVGADRVYVENFDHVYTRRGGPHHPDAEGQFGSLVGFEDANSFTVTSYGRVFQWYARQYKDKHPRPYTWRHARCKIAIVRFPDSSWGGRGGEFRDRLLGAKDQPSTPTTEAWFEIWHLLSLGTIPNTGLSFNSHHTANLGPTFFCPMPEVLVFDHRIADQIPDFDFRGAEVIFLTGITVTDSTLALIEKRVKEGVTCIALPHLVPEHIERIFPRAASKPVFVDSGKGRWIVTEDFAAKHVANAVREYLPKENEMRYIFGSRSLILKRDGSNDRTKVLLDGVEILPES